MPRRCDLERHHVLDVEALRRARAHARRIQPMHLGQCMRDAIELRASSTATLDRQIERFETLVESPSCRIDSGGISQRRFHMGQQTCQPSRILLEELPNILIALALVAWCTCRHEVAHTVGAIAATRVHMVEFQRDIARVTVGALMIPLQEHVPSDFVPFERPLLILDAFDLRIL
jgi:hypothetical protein